MAFRYRGRFKSDKGAEYHVIITDTFTKTQPPGSSNDYDLGPEGFTLTYHGNSKDLFDPVLPSSVKFTFLVDNSVTEALLTSDVIGASDKSIYCLIFKDEAFFWWGYIQTGTMSIDYEYYPVQYNFEAIDSLALSKSLNYWEVNGGKNYTGQQKSVRVSYNTETTSRIGMGYRGYDPSTASVYVGSAPDETISITGSATSPVPFIGSIFSLIYDMNLDITPQDLSVITYLNHYDSTAWPRIFEDVWLKNLAWWMLQDGDRVAVYPDLNEPRDMSLYQMLQDLMKSFNFRLFQVDGKYVMAQVGAYTESTLTEDKYQNNDTQAYIHPNNGQGYNFNPEYQSTTTHTTNDFVASITAPRTDPALLEGGAFVYDSSIKQIVYSAVTGPSMRQGTKYYTGLTDFVVSLSEIASPKHTFSIGHDPNNFGYLGVTGPFVGSTVGSTAGFGGNIFQQPLLFTRGNETTYRTVIGNMLTERFECLNGQRKVFRGTIYSSDYNIFKALEFNGDRYLCTGYSLNANEDEFQGEWYELEKTAYSGEILER